tara:strand:+ start:773 stop:2830 length:2058 start_codon:yes stop_codon:yes gene_type:complete
MATNRIVIQASTKGVKSAQTAVRGLSLGVKGLITTMAPLIGAYKIFEGLKTSIQMSGEIKGVEQSFKNLSKSVEGSSTFLADMRKQTNGTVSDLELMKQANNAMLLGIVDSGEQFAELTDMGQRLAKAVGQDATYGIESLTTGIGRQSRMMLDNLGIIVDTNKAYADHAKKLGKSTSELTDAEKKTAFTNATLESAREKVARLGEEQLTTADKTNRASASIQNFGVKLGDALTPAYEMSLEVISTALDGIGSAIDTISKTEIDTDKLFSLNSVLVMSEMMHKTFGLVFSVMRQNIGNIGIALGNAMLTGAKKIFDFFAEWAGIVKTYIGDPLIIGFKIAFNNVKLAFVKVANFMNNKLNSVIETFVKGYNKSIAKLPRFDPIDWKPETFDNTIKDIEEKLEELKGSFASTDLIKNLFPDEEINSVDDFMTKLNEIYAEGLAQMGITTKKKSPFSPNPDNEEESIETQIPSFAERLKASLQEMADGITEFMQGAGQQIQATMGMANTTLNAYKSNVMSRKNAEIKAMRETDEFKNASSEKQASMEKRINSKYASEQTKIWVGEQALNLSRVAMNTAQAVTKVAPNPVLMGLMSAMGVTQAGLILSQKPPKYAQHGTDEIVSSPTTFMTGEAGRERVTITPLDLDDQASDNASINVSFSGNVMSDDFIEEQAIPKIRDAIRRGVRLA